jgi:hypothetical protein
MESVDRELRRASIRDVVRYDALSNLCSFVLGVVWLIVAAIWIFDPEGAAAGDNPRDTVLILALASTAWLALVDGRRRRLNRVLAGGRVVPATVELSMHSGHWLRLTLSFSDPAGPTERTVVLASTRRNRRVSRGDRVHLVTSPDQPKTQVLPDVLFGTFTAPEAGATAPEAGATAPGAASAVDLYLDNVFRTTPDGQLVFLPWGGTRGGHVLASEEDKPRLRRGVSRFWTTALLGGFLGLVIGMAGRDGAVASCADFVRIVGFAGIGLLPGVLLHAVWVRGAVRGLPRYRGAPFGPPPHAAVLMRSYRSEWRWAAFACAGLGVLCLGLGLGGVAPPCLAIVFALTCFAGAAAFVKAVRTAT